MTAACCLYEHSFRRSPRKLAGASPACSFNPSSWTVQRGSPGAGCSASHMRRRHAPPSSDAAEQPYLWVPLHFSSTRPHYRLPFKWKEWWQGEALFFFLKTAKYVLRLFLCNSQNILIPHSCSAPRRQDMLDGSPPDSPLMQCTKETGHARRLPFFPPMLLRSCLPANTQETKDDAQCQPSRAWRLPITGQDVLKT